MFSLLAPIAFALSSYGAQQPALHQKVEEILARNESVFVALRRDLHRHPETSGNEVRTSQIVAERMRALGLEVRTGVGGYGVVAILRGGKPGPLVAYRADMDAVPSTDPDPVDYKSVVPGVRHICGHDIHTSVAVALATALRGVKDELPGSVMFIFQPAEETATGAKSMLMAGIFAKEKPVAIYGLHTAPYETGKISSASGVMMSMRDLVTVTVAGSGNIAAASDTVRQFLSSLSTIPIEKQYEPAGANFTMVQLRPVRATPGKSVVSAMISLGSERTRLRVSEQIAQRVASLKIRGVTITQVYEKAFIAGVTNSLSTTLPASTVLRKVLGDSNVVLETGVLPAFSEDFGSFQEQVPGTFFFLGVSNASKSWKGMPHSPGYVADDGAVRVGARAMSAVLLDRLSRGG